MHIRLLYKKVLYVFLSLAIVIAPAIQQANAASGWTVTDVKNTGGRVIVTATKGGYKSAINIAPSVARLALKLAKGANWASLLYAAMQMMPDIKDIEAFQPDYSNNAIKYRDTTGLPSNGLYWYTGDYTNLSATQQELAEKWCALKGLPVGTLYATQFSCYGSPLKYSSAYGKPPDSKLPNPVYKSIPLSDISAQVIKNAAAGHAPSQEAVRQAATEMVVAGDFDRDLLGGAVPINDSRPLVPAVPISGNGNVASGDIDGGMTGGDVGKAADDARKAADDARKAAQAAADVYRDAAEAARKAADDAQSVINSAVDQAIKDIAAATAAAAEKAAADSKAVADTAAVAAAEKAAESVRAAERVYSDAVAAVETATAENKAAAVAAAEKAAESVKAAEKAAEKAKAQSAKPFELPAFCTWAAVVCDYTVWVKEEYGKAKDWVKEEPVTTPAEMMPIDDDPTGIGNIFQDKAEAGYVSFESSCPADVLIPVDLMGASQTLTISYTPFCHFASLIRYAVILGAWISGLLIVTGGRSRE